MAAGLYAALATIWTIGTGGSIATMIVLGVLLIIAGLWSLMMPKLTSMQWIVAILGALMFIAPWVIVYATHMGAAWTSWICGAIAVIVGLWGLAPAAETQRHAGEQVAH